MTRSQLKDRSATKALSSSRKSVAKRDAIIRVAIEIINEKSYALATMTEIAASLDLRDAALYYYFPNKRALAYACHVRSLERFEGLLAEAYARDGSGLDKLRRFIGDFLHESEQNGPQLYFGDHSYLDEAERRAIDAWAERLTATLERYIRDGMADGSMIDCEPHLVVRLILGMLIWLAKWVPSVQDCYVQRLSR